MTSRLTVRGRVTLASVLVLALGLALLTFGINLLLTRQLDADARSALRERAAAEIATLGRRDGRTVVRDTPYDGALDQRSWIFALDGRPLERPSATTRVSRAAAALARVSHVVDRTVGESVRLRAAPVYDRSGRRYGTVVVGISLKPYEDTEHTALVATLLLDVFVLLVGALVARRAVGNALRPVADMTTRAADWTEHDLEQRFNLGPPRDELTALSATLDAMLARIAASLRHEQRFSAEMAHELRTPLSGVRAEAELASKDPTLSPDTREGLEEILRGTDRMEGVIETLLAAARRDASQAPGAADAGAAAASAVESVRKVAEREGVEVRMSDLPANWRAGADGDMVAQALQPLLDNAVRHARRAVRVRLDRKDDTITIVVEDDGEGLPPIEAGRLFEPGVSTEGGAGLGLALARRLARSCGGEVVAVPGDEGARFELRLPAVA